MAKKSNPEVERLVNRIIEDTDLQLPSVVGSLQEKAESMPQGEVEELIKLLRTKNPPILGTGTVS